MTHTRNSVAAAAATGAILGCSSTGSTQAILDAENRYANVGTVMVWRVDAAEKPVELRGVPQWHADWGSRHADCGSLHGAGDDAGDAAAIDPHLCQLQSG